MIPVASAATLYAHALAIEREAAERYAELGQHMADLGNAEVAALFAALARMEAEHLETLERRTDGVPLPPIAPSEYRWLDAGAPETAAHELIFRLMTPHDALVIALAAEKRAQAFFRGIRETATDPALRALAQEMAMEETEHVALVERLLARTPRAGVDWEALFSPDSRNRGQ